LRPILIAGRGAVMRDDPDAGKNYAADVKNVLDYATPGQIAAFIAESIQGVGGCVVFPDGYLKNVYDKVSSQTSSRWPKASEMAARSAP
jgi:4-aminobutyrate aminotransferase-like enzyme